MFGMHFKSICPNCGETHNVSLGAGTCYYMVNNDTDLEYTPYTCPWCARSYWLSHSDTGVILGTRKRKATDEVEAQGVTCW